MEAMRGFFHYETARAPEVFEAFGMMFFGGK
jgi:hypothetical protein